MKSTLATRLMAAVGGPLLSILYGGNAVAADRRVPAEYPTIQAAVDASADGDTIHVASGIYAAQVFIQSKKLTILGQPGAILRATADMKFSEASPSHVVPIMEIAASDIRLRGLMFEGEHLAEAYPSPQYGNLEAVLSRASSVTIENCSFFGFRRQDPGPEAGTAVVFVNISSSIESVSLRITGCTFADNDSGIVVSGASTRQSVQVTIENNTIMGLGLGPGDGSEGGSGILLQEGVGGRIAGNTISGFSYTGNTAEFPFAWGLLAASSAVPFVDLRALVIEGNTFRENQMHVALIRANDSILRNNRFEGTAPGLTPLGTAASGTNVIIAGNQFENLPEGIRLLGGDPLSDSVPGLGDLLGVAIKAQVSSNRFCNVAKPIQLQAPATATETGTLLNTCSTNGLAVVPAVLVSWPAGKPEWTVESAPSVDGPWVPSLATPFLQEGRYNIAVPTVGGGQYFRPR